MPTGQLDYVVILNEAIYFSPCSRHSEKQIDPAARCTTDAVKDLHRTLREQLRF